MSNFDKPTTFREYQEIVKKTDKLPGDDFQLPVLGLFGEVGSLLAVIKKKRRDFVEEETYNSAIQEELGDSFWYFACIANRAGLRLSNLAEKVFQSTKNWEKCEESLNSWGDLQRVRPSGKLEILSCMAILAQEVGGLVGHLRNGQLQHNRDILSGDLISIMRALVDVAEATGTSMDRAARTNGRKVLGRYPETLKYPGLPDENMPENERLPRKIEMRIEEFAIGEKAYVIQKCNGIIIGDRLTDNKLEKDDYRFHDVFHLAYAVHLSWSPVLRSLFRVKRKSDPRVDEAQDGARATLIEEGISTFVFGRALKKELYKGVDRVELDTLNFIQEFVAGYEPEERCELWQWEKAILDGYKIFRCLKKHRRGLVTANLVEHTIEFKEIVDDS